MSPNSGEAKLVRLLHHLPPAMRDTFDADQRRALERALGAEGGKKAVDLRVSLPWIRRNVFVRLIVGRESRSVDRLRQEGQVSAAKSAAVYFVILLLLMLALGASGAVFLHAVRCIAGNVGTTECALSRNL